MRKLLQGGFFSLLVLFLCLIPTGVAEADSVGVQPFIALGADLTSSEKSEVLELLGITEAELEDYETIEVTNEEEHEYLDEYLASSVIGTRALSSVMIEEADADSGITVETHNISFCSEEMYTNALVTAGISDAKVTVVGPFSISGTAALVGAMKAYGVMTGDVIDEDSSDAATNELVVTGELGDDIGQDEAAEFVALLKDKVVSGGLTSQSDIEDAIDDVEDELGVSISDDMESELTALMEKISALDLDLDNLKSQAQGVYDKLQGLGIDIDDAEGVWAKICSFFASIASAIAGFFKGLLE